DSVFIIYKWGQSGAFRVRKNSGEIRMHSSTLLMLFSLCVSAQLSFADSVPIKVEKAWIQSIPEVSDSTAAYMKIINLGGSPLRLTGGSSPAAKTGRTHDHYQERSSLFGTPPGRRHRTAHGLDRRSVGPQFGLFQERLAGRP